MKRTQELISLREKNNIELAEALAIAKADLFQFRTDVAMRALANVKSIGATRKRIARILTLAQERQMAAVEEQK